MQRKMSAAIVTSEDAEHEFLEGRPKIVMSQSNIENGTNTSTTASLGSGRPPHLQQHRRAESSISPGVTSPSAPNTPGSSQKRTTMMRPPSVRRSFTMPMGEQLTDFVLHPPPLRVEYWADAPAEKFKVRGKTYMKDKVKVLSEPSVFRLLTVDLLQVDEPIMTGMCSHPSERIQMALRREQETGIRELPDFIWAINYVVPANRYFHWVAYFGVDDVSVLRDTSTPLGRLAEPFFFGNSDKYRDNTFKLIPRIVDGNFVVRKAVGSKPSILGRKLKQHYVRNDRFFELILDIGSDSVADRIVRLALGYAKTLVVDMMFLLEGNEEEELPERILAGARVQNCDFKKKDIQRRCQKP